MKVLFSRALLRKGDIDRQLDEEIQSHLDLCAEDFLACIGLYGLMSHRVAQRTAEIGVRMARGAARRQVLWMVLRQDAIWIAAGIAIGGAAAVAVSRFIRSLLFGIDAGSPSAMIIPVFVMLAIGVIAAAGPAARAARIDPAVSLRHD